MVSAREKYSQKFTTENHQKQVKCMKLWEQLIKNNSCQCLLCQSAYFLHIITNFHIHLIRCYTHIEVKNKLKTQIKQSQKTGNTHVLKADQSNGNHVLPSKYYSVFHISQVNSNIIHTKEHYVAMKIVTKTQRLMIAYRFKIFFLLMFQVFFNEHIQAKNKHKNS